MKKREITLLRMRESTPDYDMHILFDQLNAHKAGESINMYVADIAVKNQNMRQVYHFQLEELAKEKTIWVSMDGFLGAGLEIKSADTEHILIATPTDSLYRARWDKSTLEEYAVGFDRIIVPSAWWSRVFRECGAAGKVEIIDGVALPFLEKCGEQKEIARSRRTIESRFPQLKGKRIIYVYFEGEKKNGDRNNYQAVDMQKIMQHLPEDVAIVTNSLNLRFASRVLDSGYRDRFVFVEGIDSRMDFLMTAEAILSNSSYCCSIADSIDRSYRVVQFSECEFEAYCIANKMDIVRNAREMEAAILEILFCDVRKSPEFLRMDGKRNLAQVLLGK